VNALLSELNERVGGGLAATEEQVRAVKDLVNSYVAEHPPLVGGSTVIPGPNGQIIQHSPSYDPLLDLQINAMARRSSISPLTLGILMNELLTRQELQRDQGEESRNPKTDE
jgi:hypothetical protein